MEASPTAPAAGKEERWRFLRDVVVFQLKMVVDNLRDLALMPVSLGAALLDLLFGGKREGALFYRVLRWGAQSERMIDVYSAIDQHGPVAVDPNYTIDGVISRLERIVVQECEKGGTAAAVKAAMDRAIDELHKGTSPAREKAGELVARAAGKVRPRADGYPTVGR